VVFTIFSCLSARSVNDEMGFLIKTGEVEPSFEEFLASPAMMHLGLLSIKPDVVHTKSFPS
jgi:hypothetical protein